MAQIWVAATYDDLRRAGPDRGTRVRGVLDRYVIPWFGPQTTSVGDITYFMVHEWLLMLVGRGRSESDSLSTTPEFVGAPRAYRELSLREAAKAGEVSVATVRRRWRDGELTGAYRDSHGCVRVPETATATLRRAKRERERPVGLSQAVVSDALWVLRRVLAFARANGLVPPGFDPTEGLDAPTPDAVAARRRQPTCQPRPLSFSECARIAAHLHPVHQLVLWLQRVMGLRISEAFGLLVDDFIDLGDTGLLVVRGPGGRVFRVRDDEGRVVSVQYKERTKTEAGTRVMVLPAAMLEPLRVAIEASTPIQKPARSTRRRASSLVFARRTSPVS